MYTCTVNWWWHVCFSYESNARIATGSVFVCVSMSAQNLLTDWQNLNTDWNEFAQSLQFINSLSASKSNLSWAAHKNLRSACLVKSSQNILTFKGSPIMSGSENFWFELHLTFTWPLFDLPLTLRRLLCLQFGPSGFQ